MGLNGIIAYIPTNHSNSIFAIPKPFAVAVHKKWKKVKIGVQRLGADNMEQTTRSHEKITFLTKKIKVYYQTCMYAVQYNNVSLYIYIHSFIIRMLI